jgi:DtxR family Mn-dependent transcriptional regulator
MRTEADENYLKEIYNLSLDNTQVTTSMLAERLGYTPATVSGMLKKLAGLGWVDYEPYQGVTLTESGRAVALEVIRHHRLIETYLARALNIPWERVHEEAERLEHSLSEYLEERIDERLGRPTTDPHGSPIPSHAGEISHQARLRLVDLSSGDRGVILEVNDRIPELLTQLDQRKLYPGTEFEVLNVEPIDGLITVRASGKEHILGRTTAGQIMVRKLSQT